MPHSQFTQIALRQRGRGWHSERGELGLWLLEPGVVIVRLSGHGEAAFSPLIERGILTSLESAPQFWLFFDLYALDSYDSALRVDLTAAIFKQRDRMADFHVLVRSKIVAMGVSVANLALGGRLTSHRERKPFTTALQAALDHAKISGFSTQILGED